MNAEDDLKPPKDDPYLGPRKYYPTYIHNGKKYSELFKIIPLPMIICGIVPPMCAAIFSIFIALTFHNDDISNYKWTCGRARFPSLSRIINLPIERALWQLFVLAHLPIRVVEVFVLFKRFDRLYNVYHRFPRIFMLARYLYLILGLGELFFLGGLSLVGERENTKLHVILFYIFGVIGLGFFIVNTYCHRFSLYYFKPYGRLSFKLKILFMSCYVAIAPIVVISFFLYWKKCYTWAYDIFALSEYAGVFCNIAFHSTAILDTQGTMVLSVRLVQPADQQSDVPTKSITGASLLAQVHQESTQQPGDVSPSKSMKKSVTFSRNLCQSQENEKSTTIKDVRIDDRQEKPEVKSERSSIQMDL